MSRVVYHFITLCVAVVAACVAVALYFVLDTPPAIAAFIGLTLLAFVVMARANAAERNTLRLLTDEIDDDRRTLDGLIQRVERFEARLRTAESAPRSGPSDQTNGEIATLGALVKDLADAVSVQEAKVAALAVAPRQQVSPQLGPQSGSTAGTGAPRLPQAEPFTLPAVVTQQRPVPQPPPSATQPGLLPPAIPPSAGRTPPFSPPKQDPAMAEVSEAIEAARVEIYLQPIVTLPQRKVQLYEAIALLRAADGRGIPAREFEPAAEATGLAIQLDGTLVLRAVQIARKLSARNRELVVISRLSRASLASERFVGEVVDLVAATPGLSSQLAFAIAQAEFAALGNGELDGMRRLGAAGVRFALDRVGDLRLDGRMLGSRGVKYVKAAASLLLDESGAASEIHAADLSGLLGRYGVDLIAEGIEAEPAVADLLDLDLRFGQGNLFSPPRPVRAEILSEGGSSPPPPQPVAPPPAPAFAPAPPAPELRARPDAAITPPQTLGQAALQDAIDRLRKTQEEPPPDPVESERRSAWRMLARRVGVKERT